MSQNKAERDEAAILKVRGKFRAELLKWVVNPEHKITQDVNKFLDVVMKDRRRFIEVFLTALARKYVERTVFFVGRLPEIEEELLDPRRLKTMKNSDLIRLLGVISDQVEGASEFLLNFVTPDELRSEPLPSPGSEFDGGAKEVIIDDVLDEERKAAAELPAESRQRMGGILVKMLKSIDIADEEQKLMLLVSPKSDNVSSKGVVDEGSQKSKVIDKSKGGS